VGETTTASVVARTNSSVANHKVLLAGIDGSGKSSCLDALIERMQQRDFSVTKVVNKDGSIYRNGKRTLIYGRFFEMVESSRGFAQKLNIYSIFLAVKFLYKLLVIKHVLRRPITDLTMFEIDLLLHPSVYMTYHFPRLSRWLGRTRRFRLMTKLTGAAPDFSVFYLEVDPEVSMERIRKRGIHIARHENVDDLTKLAGEFDSVIAVAEAHGYDVVRVNTNDKNLDQVADEIEGILASRLET
jgi:thymidylate kinase